MRNASKSLLIVALLYFSSHLSMPKSTLTSVSSASPLAGDDPVAHFEAALQELEGIVQALERGELKLEDSLQRFERGMALSRQCRAALDSAEQKVRTLLEHDEPDATA
jgi:exodeoxyribonuclease VII small subunit